MVTTQQVNFLSAPPHGSLDNLWPCEQMKHNHENVVWFVQYGDTSISVFMLIRRVSTEIKIDSQI